MAAKKFWPPARARRKGEFKGGIPPRPSVPPSVARRSIPLKIGSDLVKQTHPHQKHKPWGFMFLIINATIEVYGSWNTGGRPLLPLVGIIIIAAIFTVAFWISSERNPPLFSRMTICPACNGTGKMPDQAHDSSDLQFIECGRCEGSGEIDLDTFV